jgi:hypothetical protein
MEYNFQKGQKVQLNFCAGSKVPFTAERKELADTTFC